MQGSERFRNLLDNAADNALDDSMNNFLNSKKMISSAKVIYIYIYIYMLVHILNAAYVPLKYRCIVMDVI